MDKYKVVIHPKALSKITEINEWYNNKQTNLGKRFKRIIIEQIDSLAIRPKIYAIKYENFRCMETKVFPYMVHFVVDDISKMVNVYLVIGTKENPDKWGLI